MTTVELLPPGASREAWLAARMTGIGASEIAAVLGISPWESPFSLYWRKANRWETGDAEHLEAGRRAEAFIADWFADRYDPLENLAVRAAGIYQHPDRPWQLATPDRVIALNQCACAAWDEPGETLCSCLPDDPIVAVLECKHPYNWDGFGDDGTADIPVYYRAQLLWQMDVLGVDEGFLAAYTGHQLRIYPLRRDEADLRVMRAAGAAFMDRLAAGDPPDVDEHTATLATLKRLHPSLVDGDVETDAQFAEGYRRARAAAKRAGALVARFEARARVQLGDKRRLMCGGRLVASRSVYDRKPYEVGPSIVDRLNPGRSATYLLEQQ